MKYLPTQNIINEYNSFLTPLNISINIKFSPHANNFGFMFEQVRTHVVQFLDPPLDYPVSRQSFFLKIVRQWNQIYLNAR